MGKPVIEVRNLTKEYRINSKKEGLSGAIVNLLKPRYEIKTAVNNINFCIDEGESVGYIGANGAGKSTTIKMLTGVIHPTSGEVLVNKINPQKDRIKNNINIGAVFGQRTQLWWDIPVIESYKLIGKLYEVSQEDFETNIDKFTRLLELENLLKVPVRQLSLGQKMRCEIGAAFIHNPKIVFLDEPTIGLDIIVKDKIRSFIRDINEERKVTVILTTHDLQDIKEVCNRIIVLDNGSIIYDGGIGDKQLGYGKYRIVKFKIGYVDREALDAYYKKNKDDVIIFQEDKLHLAVKFNRFELSASSIISTVASYCDIIDLSIEEPSIESIVREIYRK